ncbi:hypothetical protein BH11ARM2_BH11ARM2_08800 [soil metagenome]
MEFRQRLDPFARRVRFVRAWRGMAVGAVFGAGGAAALAGLDYANVRYTEWWEMGAVFGVVALVGAIVGAALPVRREALARSIDRRAGLRDRLETAMVGGDTAMEEAQREDASEQFGEIKPAKVFPLRGSRWQTGAVAGAVAASAIFLLGNSPLLMSSSVQEAAAQNKADAARVEHVLRETFQDPKEQRELTADEKRLVQEALELKKALDKGRMSREEALQKADELQKKAEELAKNSATDELKTLDKAETAMQKIEKAALDKAGLQKADPQMTAMSDAQRNQALAQNAEERKQLENALAQAMAKMNQLQKQLANPNLSDAERKKLEKELEDAKKAAQAAQKGLEANKAEEEALKLSAEAMKVLEKMQGNPLFKKLQEMAAKMKASAQQASQNGGQPSMTKEQRLQMQKELEEMLAKLKDDKAMDAYLKALLESMKHAGGT